MPGSISSRGQPRAVGYAAIQWLRSRRGRVFVLSMLLGVVVLLLGVASNSETLSTSYQTLSYNYPLPSWHSRTTTHLSSYFASPLKPSNASLELENDQAGHVPSQLNKATPNFHLVMPAVEDGLDFCRSTLSAMILNYPPPTIVGLNERFDSDADREKARLLEIHGYLTSERLVNDEDVMLIVDGKETWFQLPSDVLIRQYQEVLEDANARLFRLYGGMFKQTIVFGATKVCENDDVACQHMPEPMLPAKIFGPDTGKETRTTRARFIDSTMLLGPVRDLKTLYREAVRVMEEGQSQSSTVQSVMATIFARQQMARDRHRQQFRITQATNKLLGWLDMSPSSATANSQKVDKAGLGLQDDPHQYEMSMGLDYAHTLFQPFENCAQDELLSLVHDNTADLSKHHHPGTPTPPLTLPKALQHSLPPYWTPDFSHNNPSPNEKPVYIDPLEYQEEIDKLPNRDSPWTSTPLVQNTYTGTIPAAFRTDDVESARLPGLSSSGAHTHSSRLPPPSNISWSSLWYAGHERALLRNYFRIPQSSVGYHNVAVGGDRLWDQRGGRGGVWTAKEGLWLPWGEVDGVCGSVELLRAVFADGKGVWLHEVEGVERSEEVRAEEERKYREAVEKKKEKEKEKDDEEEGKAAKEVEEESSRKQKEGEQEEQKQKEEEGKEADKKDEKTAEEKNNEEEEEEAKAKAKAAQQQQKQNLLLQQNQEKEEEGEKVEKEQQQQQHQQQKQKQHQKEESTRLLGEQLTKWQDRMDEEYARVGMGLLD